MDKYDAKNDSYCYANTSTLKNKLNIKDLSVLEAAERDITTVTVRQVGFKYPPYDIEYMKFLHKKLFSELYDWAGNIRSVDISKGGTRFCNCGRVVPEAQKLFMALKKENWLSNLKKDEFCERLAEYYCEFNMVHPFREGNGRVQRLLFEHIAIAAGYDLDWEFIQRSEWIQANIDGVAVNYEPMNKIFKRIIRVL